MGVHATEVELRTGWFVESVTSAAMIVLVIRTQRVASGADPAGPCSSTLLVVGLTLLLPYSPLARPLGFVPLPASFLAVMGLVVLLYVVAAETAKSVFYRGEERRGETDPAVISTRPTGVFRRMRSIEAR